MKFNHPHHVPRTTVGLQRLWYTTTRLFRQRGAYGYRSNARPTYMAIAAPHSALFPAPAYFGNHVGYITSNSCSLPPAVRNDRLGMRSDGEAEPPASPFPAVHHTGSNHKFDPHALLTPSHAGRDPLAWSGNHQVMHLVSHGARLNRV